MEKPNLFVIWEISAKWIESWTVRPVKTEDGLREKNRHASNFK